MKSWLKIVVKIVGGGLGSVFLYLSWGLLKDVISYFVHGIPCEDLIYIPFTLAFQFIHVPSWDDWTWLFFIFGSLFVLVTQVRSIVSAPSQNYPKRRFVTLQVVLLILFGLSVTFEVQNEFAIKRAYSEVCQAAKGQTYELAYFYFSPEYRNQTGLKRFTKEIKDLVSFGYFDGCEGKFAGAIYHRWNGSFLYPYEYTASACYFFMGGPELTLVRINGRWYFTGEHRWFMD